MGGRPRRAAHRRRRHRPSSSPPACAGRPSSAGNARCGPPTTCTSRRWPDRSGAPPAGGGPVGSSCAGVRDRWAGVRGPLARRAPGIERRRGHRTRSGCRHHRSRRHRGGHGLRPSRRGVPPRRPVQRRFIVDRYRADLRRQHPGHGQRPGGGPGLRRPSPGAARQLVGGVRRGAAGRAAGDRGRPAAALDAVRGEQGGSRDGRDPSLAGTGPGGRPGSSLQSHRAGPTAPVRHPGAGPPDHRCHRAGCGHVAHRQPGGEP